MDFIKKFYLECIENNHHPLEIEAADYICKYINANNISNMLEIGSGVGFSSYYFINNSNIKNIDSLEINEQYYLKAKENVKNNKVNFININFMNYECDKLYDLIFIDASKTKQIDIFNKATTLLKNNINSTIVIDNIALKRLKEKENKNTLKLLNKHNDFLNYLNELTQWEINYIDVGDVLAICKRKEK